MACLWSKDCVCSRHKFQKKHSNAIESSRSRIVLEDIDSVPKKKDHSPVNPFKRVGRNLSHLKTAKSSDDETQYNTSIFPARFIVLLT